ncbi:MAG: hypothetical protein GFGODING_02259 [Flavobacteriales bacterium]|nr:hypothetical protein [Flavobacteriales bacterium]
MNISPGSAKCRSLPTDVRAKGRAVGPGMYICRPCSGGRGRTMARAGPGPVAHDGHSRKSGERRHHRRQRPAVFRADLLQELVLRGGGPGALRRPELPVLLQDPRGARRQRADLAEGPRGVQLPDPGLPKHRLCRGVQRYREPEAGAHLLRPGGQGAQQTRFRHFVLHHRALQGDPGVRVAALHREDGPVEPAVLRAAVRPAGGGPRALRAELRRGHGHRLQGVRLRAGRGGERLPAAGGQERAAHGRQLREGHRQRLPVRAPQPVVAGQQVQERHAGGEPRVHHHPAGHRGGRDPGAGQDVPGHPEQGIHQLHPAERVRHQPEHAQLHRQAARGGDRDPQPLRGRAAALQGEPEHPGPEPRGGPLLQRTGALRQRAAQAGAEDPVAERPGGLHHGPGRREAAAALVVHPGGRCVPAQHAQRAVRHADEPQQHAVRRHAGEPEREPAGQHHHAEPRQPAAVREELAHGHPGQDPGRAGADGRLRAADPHRAAEPARHPEHRAAPAGQRETVHLPAGEAGQHGDRPRGHRAADQGDRAGALHRGGAARQGEDPLRLPGGGHGGVAGHRVHPRDVLRPHRERRAIEGHGAHAGVRRDHRQRQGRGELRGGGQRPQERDHRELPHGAHQPGVPARSAGLRPRGAGHQLPAQRGQDLLQREPQRHPGQGGQARAAAGARPAQAQGGQGPEHDRAPGPEQPPGGPRGAGGGGAAHPGRELPRDPQRPHTAQRLGTGAEPPP